MVLNTDLWQSASMYSVEASDCLCLQASEEALPVCATGGFIVGYLVCALVVGILVEKIYKAGLDGTRRIVLVIISLAAGLFCCYALGMAWFMHLTGSGLLEGLMGCVVPFLIGDGLKIALATVLIDRLRGFNLI